MLTTLSLPNCFESGPLDSLQQSASVESPNRFHNGQSSHSRICARFMCRDILRMPLDEEDEPSTALELCRVALELKREDLEWCAVGRLNDHFDSNPGAFLPREAIEHILSNTGSKSHLREWLVDHVAGCWSSGVMCAANIEGLIATSSGFAAHVMMSMQTTVTEVTKVLMDMD